MSIVDAFYYILIYPLQVLFEVVFWSLCQHVSNPGFAIIILSLIVNILVLPMYNRADKIQAQQREIEKNLDEGINHIKSTFTGDERFMMLQTYYRINSYSPAMSLRSALSLLIQIPFFIAAYNMLSSLQMINGVSFWFIRDLGAADSLFTIGSFPVNVLPILMTLINVISGLFYTKGHPLKEKIQINLMAALFLVLLYNSPAGLTFYWMLNNVFSLVKNIIIFILEKSSSISGFFETIRKKIDNKILELPDTNKKDLISFVLLSVFCALISGLFIPSKLISASPIELIDPILYDNTAKYLLYSGCIAFGTFTFWGTFIYKMFSVKARNIPLLCMGTIALVFFYDYYLLLFFIPFFKLKMPSLAYGLIYSLILCAIVFIIMRHKRELLFYAGLVGVLTMLVMSVVNINKINERIKEFNPPVNKTEMSIPLSTEGKNVVVIMLDRAVGCALPLEMEINPELINQFDGFTYYPNTISYAAHTNMASPSLFGGYEYTPDKINYRSNETLESKQNEALLVMPRLFSEEGYLTTIIDPPYAGYEEIPEIDIYDGLSNTNAYYMGSMLYEGDNDYYENLNSIRYRNYYFYGLSTLLPLGINSFVYDGGNYNNPNLDYRISTVGLMGIEGTIYDTYNEYVVLNSLIDATEIRNSNENTLLVMQNSLTHEDTTEIEEIINPALDWENYDTSINSYSDGNNYMEITLHSNTMALSILGEWLDYLRECDVYDNTRIIIVSDHGFCNDFFENIANSNQIDMEPFNPLFMYKDFNATGFNTSDEFMTNAETPYLATYNLIENCKNPFTDNPIQSVANQDNIFYITNSNAYNTNIFRGNLLDIDGYGWYRVNRNNFEWQNIQFVNSCGE